MKDWPKYQRSSLVEYRPNETNQILVKPKQDKLNKAVK